MSTKIPRRKGTFTSLGLELLCIFSKKNRQNNAQNSVLGTPKLPQMLKKLGNPSRTKPFLPTHKTKGEGEFPPPRKSYFRMSYSLTIKNCHILHLE